MSFDRTLLPDAIGYYESQGLPLQGRGKWRTAQCVFHGGSDSMRINTETGAFVCMAGCGARGGDVLAYHMAQHGKSFVEAARDLGAWVEDGKPATNRRPAQLPARDALALLCREASFVALCAANLAHGMPLTEHDKARLLQAAGRVNTIEGLVV